MFRFVRPLLAIAASSLFGASRVEPPNVVDRVRATCLAVDEM
jgi:hypothetical protein